MGRNKIRLDRSTARIFGWVTFPYGLYYARQDECPLAGAGGMDGIKRVASNETGVNTVPRR